MKVVVTLTALNEANNLGNIIPKIIEHGYDCILVDDGSTDLTSKTARNLGARVLRHCVNLGQGYAVLTSFKAALKEDCQIIIEMDADGQHDPSEIPLFIKKMETTGTDIVVGSRILGSNYENAPFFRKTFLPYFTWVINTLTGYRMTDAMCGFRAFRKDSLARVAPLLDTMLEPQYIAAEMFIRFAKAGLFVEEIPISLSDRSSGYSYKGFIRYGFGVLKAISRTLMDKDRRADAKL
jgi:glycosyltransferase involved in cell wall biosynthesis